MHFYIRLVGILTLWKEERSHPGSLWEKNVKEGELCDNPAGRHLSRGSPINSPLKEQCRKAVHTVLRTGPGV